MKLDGQKELTPVIYGDSVIKLLKVKLPAHVRGFYTHWHERMELLLIDRGTLKVQVGDEGFEACEGDLVIVNPECPHAGDAGAKGVEYRAFMFSPGGLGSDNSSSWKYLEPLQSLQNRFLSHIHDEEIKNVLDRIDGEYSRQQKGRGLVITGLVYLLLGMLYRSYQDSSRSFLPADDRFKDILDYIAGHYCEALTTEDLGRRFGYNEAYFCRRFRMATGLSPMEYIRILRLEKASAMLKSQDAKITSVALACGFEDPNYFTRRFKELFGSAPSKYRDENAAAALSDLI